MKKNGQYIERFIREGQAFIPQNMKDQGDAVQVYLKDGQTEVLDLRSDLFLKKIVDFFGTSIAVNRSRYGDLIGKKNFVPVALSYGLVLIPYNTREAIGKQSRVGWIFSRDIISMKQKSSNQTSIQLTDHHLPVLHSQRFCLDQLKNAKCIELYYREIHEPHRKAVTY
ncbi:hypothetical protein [Domibacillus mangrovi]|uniref:Uncharacterized protein n=1 Tax=Domibacillus mangrovi TaxID=1714354 RepID=A0A1Q5NZ67_9BACI|nr:hypothetical protein [Domibacillus mangrovi]OKL35304.1 hypothetical protein BLL40_16280 [Domibacillus mangrovi]